MTLSQFSAYPLSSHFIVAQVRRTVAQGAPARRMSARSSHRCAPTVPARPTPVAPATGGLDKEDAIFPAHVDHYMVASSQADQE